MSSRVQGRIDRPWRFLSIAIVLVIAILFYADWRAFQDATHQVDSARRLQDQTDLLLASVTDAETNQRGYLLTGNPAYLTPYHNAVRQIPRQLDDISRTAAATHGSAGGAHVQAQIKQVSLIRTLVHDKLTELDRTLQVRDQQGADAALAIVRSDEGRLTMDQVRSAGKMLLSGEYLTVYELQKTSQVDSTRSRVIVLVGSLCLVILLFRMGWAVDSVVAQREDLARKMDDARQLLETTLASIGDAVIVTDSIGAVSFINPVAEKLTGWTASTALGKDLSAVFTIVEELSRRPVDNTLRAMLSRASNPDEGRVLLVSSDGLERPIEDSSAPIRDVAGTVLGIVLVFRDVSTRRVAERDLARWKQIFSSAGFGIFLADAGTGKIIDVNATFAAMHGYSANQLLGIGLDALVPEGCVAKFSEELQKAREKGRNMFEQPHLRLDGSAFPSLVDVTQFRIDHAEYMAGYCSDITERKRFEDALRESEERFRTLASALPQLTWSTDSDGNIDYVNQAWITYAGWNSGADAAQYVHQYPWSDVLHPEDSATYFARWSESLQSGAPFEVQARLRRSADASYRWFLCRAVPVRDRDNQVIRWLGGCTDIQQQMEDATHLRLANEALQQSNSDLEQFAYAASHDLQEPLRMVSIYSELLKEEYGNQLDSQAVFYIDFAVGGAKRMSKLLTGLLTYSRVANAAPTASPSADSEAAVRSALLNLSSIVSDTRAAVEIGSLPAVCVSEVHLVQLFQNLIGNALKYRRDEYPGGETPQVRISALPEAEGKWLFSVSDNGIGIDPEYLTQIFGIFKRLHGSSIDGTGIGLALCQKIVERAGGRIWAESEPAKGSTFFFTLQGAETGDHARAYHNFAGRG